jgi:hypothetical protein
MGNWHQHLEPQIIQKLLRLETEAEDKDAFWLKHHRYLHPSLTTKDAVLEFLHPGKIGPTQPITYYPNKCEACGVDGVVLDSRLDDWLCAECGLIQHQTRAPFKVVVPESSIYKHNVHLHQILHELQCLRHAIPDGLIDDVREFVGDRVDYQTIKKSLRRLGYKQHYNMVPTIQQHLDPTYQPLQLTREQEENITGYFNQYIALGKLPGKKNRLNYHFVIGKICEILEYDWVLPYLHPPKGKKSLDEHERLWDFICDKLKWNIQTEDQWCTDKSEDLSDTLSPEDCFLNSPPSPSLLD